MKWATSLIIDNFKDIHLTEQFYRVHGSLLQAEAFARGARAAGGLINEGSLLAVVIVSEAGDINYAGLGYSDRYMDQIKATLKKLRGDRC